MNFFFSAIVVEWQVLAIATSLDIGEKSDWKIIRSGPHVQTQDSSLSLRTAFLFYGLHSTSFEILELVRFRQLRTFFAPAGGLLDPMSSAMVCVCLFHFVILR
jgi:hypothetical protein